MAVLSPPPPLSPHDSDRYLDDIWEAESTPRKPRSLWLAVPVLIIVIAVFWLGSYSAQHSVKPPLVGPFPGETAQTSGRVVVHIAGAVNKPGVYELAFDARVRDAIRMAGGPHLNADINAINLAAWLEDGSRVEVPTKPAAPTASAAGQSTLAPPETFSPTLPEYSAPTETIPFMPPQESVSAPRSDKAKSQDKSRERPRTQKALPEVPRETTPTGADSQNASPEFLAKNPINLNTATQEQLELLPNVGPSTAEKIIAYRKENGGFKSVEELDEVQGIGEKTMTRLRPLVTVD